MVVGAFPFAKLGFLLLRTLSKPIANKCKDRAKQSPLFRKYVCLPPAHCMFNFSVSVILTSIFTNIVFWERYSPLILMNNGASGSVIYIFLFVLVYNWCEVKTKMWLLNLGQPVQVPPLNEAMAIELGANLLGEAILFGVGAAVLVIEYRRQAIKQSDKEQQEAEEKEKLHNNIKDLTLQLDIQQSQLRELFRHVYDLESRVLKLPFSLGGKSGDGVFPKKSDKSSDVITNALSVIFPDKNSLADT